MYILMLQSHCNINMLHCPFIVMWNSWRHVGFHLRTNLRLSLCTIWLSFELQNHILLLHIQIIQAAEKLAPAVNVYKPTHTISCLPLILAAPQEYISPSGFQSDWSFTVKLHCQYLVYFICLFLTIVSRPIGAEKTYSSWKMTAKAWWLVSRSSRLLRRASVWGRDDVAELRKEKREINIICVIYAL